MFKPNTLFIVGAGSSAIFNFPLGIKLKEEVRRISDFRYVDGVLRAPDEVILSIIRRKFKEDPEALQKSYKALKVIKNNSYLAQSIDRFLDSYSHQEYLSEIGKLLIIRILSECEAKSTIYEALENNHEGQLELGYLSGTWIETFTRILFDGVSKGEEDQLSNNINIVCFNYDRCIEFYLQKALKQTFQLSDGEACRIVREAEILHPYGTIGELPDPNISPKFKVPFGNRLNESSNPWHIIESLKTFSERKVEDDLIKKVKDRVRVADIIVFLGFGFHPQNMELLKVQEVASVRQIYSTGVNISDDQNQAIKSRIMGMFLNANSSIRYSANLNIYKETDCCRLLEKLQLTISHET